MRKHPVLLLLVVALFIFGATQLWAAEAATAKEVKAKCQEAAKVLAEQGKAALPQFNDKKGPWVWKDSYVFVYDMDGKIIGHPIMPHLRNKNVLGMKDAKGKMFGNDFLAIAKSKKGHGWSQYYWPKPGAKKPTMKVSYILKVPGKAMFVGAGIANVPKAEAIKQAGD